MVPAEVPPEVAADLDQLLQAVDGECSMDEKEAMDVAEGLVAAESSQGF